MRRIRRHRNEIGQSGELVPPEPGTGRVYLPLSAADFRSGWTLDWSPELQREPLRFARRR
jgi:hypothetical protein